MPGVRGHRSHAKKCAADGGEKRQTIRRQFGNSCEHIATEAADRTRGGGSSGSYACVRIGQGHYGTSHQCRRRRRHGLNDTLVSRRTTTKMNSSSFVYENTAGTETTRLNHPETLTALTSHTYGDLEKIPAELAGDKS